MNVKAAALVPVMCAWAVTMLVTVSGGAPDPTRFATPPPGPRFAPPAQGVLFADDFSQADLARWAPDKPGVWTVWRGMLRADLPDEKQLRSVNYFGDSAWSDVALDLDMCMMRGVDKGAVVRIQGTLGVGVDVRGGSYQDVLMYLGALPMGRAAVTNANGTWNHLRIEAKGNRLRVFVNGALVIEKPEAKSARPTGRMALPAYTGGMGQCTVYYDNVVVTALQ